MIELLLAAGGAFLTGFAAGFVFARLNATVRRADADAQLAWSKARALAALPRDQDLLDRGARRGRSGTIWTPSMAAQALAEVSSVQELAELSDELAPPIPPAGAASAPIGRIERHKPFWQEIAEREHLLPGREDEPASPAPDST